MCLNKISFGEAEAIHELRHFRVVTLWLARLSRIIPVVTCSLARLPCSPYRPPAFPGPKTAALSIASLLRASLSLFLAVSRLPSQNATEIPAEGRIPMSRIYRSSLTKWRSASMPFIPSG